MDGEFIWPEIRRHLCYVCVVLRFCIFMYRHLFFHLSWRFWIWLFSRLNQTSKDLWDFSTPPPLRLNTFHLLSSQTYKCTEGDKESGKGNDSSYMLSGILFDSSMVLTFEETCIIFSSEMAGESGFDPKLENIIHLNGAISASTLNNYLMTQGMLSRDRHIYRTLFVEFFSEVSSKPNWAALVLLMASHFLMGYFN